MSTNAPARPLSRRFLLSTGTAAIATAGAVGAAVASPKPDPVFALIAAERTAFKDYLAALEVGWTDNLETRSQLDDVMYAYFNAQHEALTATPTTIAGFVAMLECFYEREATAALGSRDYPIDHSENRVLYLLRSMIDAGHGLATATIAGQGVGL